MLIIAICSSMVGLFLFWYGQHLVETIAQSRQLAVLQTLQLAVSEQAPPGAAFRAMADLYTGRFRRQLDGLANELDNGAGLSQALANIPRLIPPTILRLIDVAESTGRLPLVIARSTRRLERERNRQYQFSDLVYPLITGIIVNILVCAQVANVYGRQTIQQTATQLGVTRGEFSMIDLSPFAVVFGLVALILFFGLLSILALLFLRALARFIGLPRQLALLGSYGLQRTAILEMLATTVQANQSVERLLSLLSEKDVHRLLKKKLMKANFLVNGGLPWIAALNEVKLIRPLDRMVLESAVPTGTVGWALETIVDESAERLSDGRELLWSILAPSILVACGVVVLVHCAIVVHALSVMTEAQL